MDFWRKLRRGYKISVICVLIFMLLFNPYSRSVILFLLPLGSGIDDLLGIIAICTAIIMFFFEILKKQKNGRDCKKAETENVIIDGRNYKMVKMEDIYDNYGNKIKK